jgi:hypothetical protein
MSVSYPSSIHPLLYIQSTSSSIPECFPLLPVEQSFYRVTVYSRPRTPLPKALRKTFCRMVLLCQIRLHVSFFPVPIFGFNICPFNYGIKGDFILELTINTQRPQAESVQHPFFPPSNHWSLRPDPNPSSSTFQASILKWRTKTKLFR